MNILLNDSHKSPFTKKEITYLFELSNLCITKLMICYKITFINTFRSIVDRAYSIAAYEFDHCRLNEHRKLINFYMLSSFFFFVFLFYA